MASYQRKEIPEDSCCKYSRANGCQHVDYTRNVQEKVIAKGWVCFDVIGSMGSCRCFKIHRDLRCMICRK